MSIRADIPYRSALSLHGGSGTYLSISGGLSSRILVLVLRESFREE